MVFRTDALLCSINARLGAMLGPEPAGEDLPPLTGDWLEELLLFTEAEMDSEGDEPIADED
jgi:hypothetical protein